MLPEDLLCLIPYFRTLCTRIPFLMWRYYANRFHSSCVDLTQKDFIAHVRDLQKGFIPSLRTCMQMDSITWEPNAEEFRSLSEVIMQKHFIPYTRRTSKRILFLACERTSCRRITFLSWEQHAERFHTLHWNLEVLF